MLAALICAGLLAADGPSTATAESLKTYQEAAARIGRDAEAHVRLALWCERHGLEPERLKQLALAVRADPEDATARGLLGLVEDGPTWRRPEAVAERVRNDAELAATMAEYNGLREKAPKTADGQWDLALWCEAHGLKAEQTAHLAAVVRLDPGRDGAWKRLGFKNHHGRWMTDAQIAEAAAERAAQEQADRHWQLILEHAREHLASQAHRAAAEKTLSEIHEPRAVPMVWQVFAARGKTADQLIAAQVLGQIDAVSASRSLAMLALQSESAEVRRRAIEALDDRDPRESVGLLIGQVRTPIKYEVKRVGGPGTRGELFVEGQRFNVKRFYNAPAMPDDPGNYFDPSRLILNDFWPGQMRTTDWGDQRALMRRAFGMTPPIPLFARQQILRFQRENGNTSNETLRHMFGEAVVDEVGLEFDLARVQQNINAMQTAVATEQALQARDIALIDETNTLGHRYNDERILPALRAITGQDLGEDQDAWQKWWSDQQGYAFSPPPKKTYIQTAPTANPALNPLYIYIHAACFGAGTMVQTLTGSQTIETLQTGDRILTRDVSSGSLDYEPILAVAHNPPNETLRIMLDGGDPIVVTPIHRFWKAGKGWTMARELKVGDPIRTVDGVRAITNIGQEKVQPVFNLLVAQHHSYFVGREAALVHDNSLIEPTPHPFDATPTLAAAGDK